MSVPIKDDRSNWVRFTSNPGAAKGAVLVLLAAVLWGMSGGVGGILIDKGWDPFVITFYRGVLTLIFSVLWILCVPTTIRGGRNPRLWGWSAIAGIGVAGAFSFYFLGMERAGVAISSTLLYSAPVFVFLVGFVTGKEPIAMGKIVGLILVAVGVSLLTGFVGSSGTHLTPSSVAIGLLSGVSYAVFVFGFRYASAYGSVQSVMVIAFAVQSLILFSVVGEGAWERPADLVDLGLIGFLGIAGGGISFLIYIIGLKECGPSIASVTAMAEPITAAGFGLLVLNQALTTPQFAGAVLVVVTVTVLNVIYQR